MGNYCNIYLKDKSSFTLKILGTFHSFIPNNSIILLISAQRKPGSLCRVCSSCCKICSLGLPTKPFLATVERRSFRDDGAVNIERCESSKILSKSLESSLIRKTSSFRSEITSTSFGKASSIPRVKVTRVLSYSRKRRLKKIQPSHRTQCSFALLLPKDVKNSSKLGSQIRTPCIVLLKLCLYFCHFERVSFRGFLFNLTSGHFYFRFLIF